MSTFSRRAKAEAAKYQHQIHPKARHKYTFGSGCGAGEQGNKGFQPGNTCGGDGDGKNDAGDQGGGDRKKIDRGDALLTAKQSNLADAIDNDEKEENLTRIWRDMADWEKAESPADVRKHMAGVLASEFEGEHDVRGDENASDALYKAEEAGMDEDTVIKYEEMIDDGDWEKAEREIEEWMDENKESKNQERWTQFYLNELEDIQHLKEEGLLSESAFEEERSGLRTKYGVNPYDDEPTATKGPVEDPDVLVTDRGEGYSTENIDYLEKSGEISSSEADAMRATVETTPEPLAKWDVYDEVKEFMGTNPTEAEIESFYINEILPYDKRSIDEILEEDAPAADAPFTGDPELDELVALEAEDDATAEERAAIEDEEAAIAATADESPGQPTASDMENWTDEDLSNWADSGEPTSDKAQEMLEERLGTPGHEITTNELRGQPTAEDMGEWSNEDLSNWADSEEPTSEMAQQMLDARTAAGDAPVTRDPDDFADNLLESIGSDLDMDSPEFKQAVSDPSTRSEYLETLSNDELRAVMQRQFYGGGDPEVADAASAVLNTRPDFPKPAAATDMDDEIIVEGAKLNLDSFSVGPRANDTAEMLEYNGLNPQDSPSYQELMDMKNMSGKDFKAKFPNVNSADEAYVEFERVALQSVDEMREMLANETGKTLSESVDEFLRSQSEASQPIRDAGDKANDLYDQAVAMGAGDKEIDRWVDSMFKADYDNVINDIESWIRENSSS
ncbi:MAG: hypothetical protein Tp1124DCM412911_2 [Prokaryotic dsDNA virus sp.]|nr:MAG: hypothetical protein Tp1124DCM412911_2 [Prokaryotic dsDNA virus sp.]|tara:strand:+ start:9739 stop:11946 length:2208 start_codon:yes stop_codon:yes gene_type:complete